MKKKIVKKLTLRSLAARVARLEKQMKEISYKAQHAYIHTARIGGAP